MVRAILFILIYTYSTLLMFLNAGDLQSCRPFIVCGKQVGLMQPRVIEAALRHPDVFVTDSTGAIWLNPSLKTYDERSSVMNRVLSQWKEEALFVTLKGWRDEVIVISFFFINRRDDCVD